MVILHAFVTRKIGKETARELWIDVEKPAREVTTTVAKAVAKERAREVSKDVARSKVQQQVISGRFSKHAQSKSRNWGKHANGGRRYRSSEPFSRMTQHPI